MAVTAQWSNHGKYHLALGTPMFNGDILKIALMNSAFVFNIATHQNYSDISVSEIVNGSGYITGGNTLAGILVTQDNTNNWADIKWNSTTWLASGGSIGPSAGAIIYDNTEIAKVIIGYINFGASQTATDGGSITINNIEVRLA